MKSRFKRLRKHLRVLWLTFILLLTLVYVIHLGQYGFYRLRWNSKQMSSYSITVTEFGLCPSDPFSVTVTDGQVTSSVRGITTSTPQSPDWNPDYYQRFLIEERFQDALLCNLSPFCIVRYNDEWGFPELVDNSNTVRFEEMFLGILFDYCRPEIIGFTPAP